MIQFNQKLLRHGGNQLGVLMMAAGLIAYFIEPGVTDSALVLVFLGVIIYLTGAIVSADSPGSWS